MHGRGAAMPEKAAVAQNPALLEAPVRACQVVADSVVRLRLEAPQIIDRAVPGQFVMAGPLRPGCYDPFLNRPLSIHRGVGGGQLELLVGVVGRGTRMLASLQGGAVLQLLGPLGRGFSVPPDADPVLLVAGGLGVAPLVFLGERLAAAGRRPLLLMGAASQGGLLAAMPLQRAGLEVRQATDDGTAGFHGTVVDLLEHVLEKLRADPARAYLAACGPLAMMRAAHRLAYYRRLALEVSLESRMACGVGACLGCSLFLADGRPHRVCADGPVFDSREVFGS